MLKTPLKSVPRLKSAFPWTSTVPAPFITGDLSFISLTLVLPALVPLLQPDGDLLMLVKPQFELQPGQVGKGGIVRDPGAVRGGGAAPARRSGRPGPARVGVVRLSHRRWRRQP